jgi:hypothetical protein
MLESNSFTSEIFVFGSGVYKVLSSDTWSIVATLFTSIKSIWLDGNAPTQIPLTDWTASNPMEVEATETTLEILGSDCDAWLYLTRSPTLKFLEKSRSA